MPTGRPSSYSAEMVEKTRHYIDTYKDHGDEIPQVAGLAGVLGVSRASLYKWADEHEEFSDILSKLKAEQRRVLFNNGLNSTFNPTITKLILSHAHGVNEKTEQEHTVNLGDKSTDELKARFLELTGQETN